MAASVKTLDNLEKMPEFQCGLWYSPYVKVYSIGGPNRIAEISNYPRAYKDTSPHVYAKDIPFIVTEGDLNHEVNGDRFYRDSKEGLFRVGEKATHWIGDSLPGAFPLWVESESLPFTPNTKEHIFSLDKVPAPIQELSEAGIRAGNVYVKLSKATLDSVVEKLSAGRVVFLRQPTDSDKQVIRVRYRRVL